MESPYISVNIIYIYISILYVNCYPKESLGFYIAIICHTFSLHGTSHRDLGSKSVGFSVAINATWLPPILRLLTKDGNLVFVVVRDLG